mmetsp:Transcript_12307/g.27302  ORF Transcript_12307/g.27302 Transcript_12307/m.27302 type:complete len:220 (+) Transcript_12307:430-1089(+)
MLLLSELKLSSMLRDSIKLIPQSSNLTFLLYQLSPSLIGRTLGLSCSELCCLQVLRPVAQLTLKEAVHLHDSRLSPLVLSLIEALSFALQALTSNELTLKGKDASTTTSRISKNGPLAFRNSRSCTDLLNRSCPSARQEDRGYEDGKGLHHVCWKHQRTSAGHPPLPWVSRWEQRSQLCLQIRPCVVRFSKDVVRSEEVPEFFDEVHVFRIGPQQRAGV